MTKLLAIVKKHALRVLLSLIILSVFVLNAAQTVKVPLLHEFLEIVELKLYDIRLIWSMNDISLEHQDGWNWQIAAKPVISQDPRIVIVEINEQSLSEIGRWPWSRQTLATMLDSFFNYYQVDVVGFDVLFAEPDNSSGLSILEKLGQTELKDSAEYLDKLVQLREKLDYDEIFAQKMVGRRIVLGYSLVRDEHQMGSNAGVLPDYIMSAEEAAPLLLHRGYDAKSYAGNLNRFIEQAIASGHFDVEQDIDGVVRRVPVLRRYEGQWYESLALAMVRIILSEPFVDAGDINVGFRYLVVGNRTIPIDRHAQALVPFIGMQRSFPYVSASDVINRKVDPSILKDKIVLVGATAQGLLDMRVTPVQETFPGVEIHANLISGILDNRIMIDSEYLHTLEIILLILTGLIMIALLPLFSPFFALLGTLGLFGLVWWFNLFVWTNAHMVLPMASITIMMLAQFLFNMSYGYFVESRGKRELASLFGQYIPPELVAEMSENFSTEQFSMEGESRPMTVLFSDVRGFTTISEGLSPKELSTLMNAFLTPMTKIIHENRGTIDKYMGDAIMAFWGAPLHDEKHARQALDAAMQMIERLHELQPEFRAKGWPEIRIGVGLNTGVMSVGNMGSEFRMAYTVLGDAVNLGSRLEGLTKQYGVEIIVSETTREAVPEYAYRELDRVRVKGKDVPISIYQPLGLRENIEPTLFNELTRYEQALSNYRNQAWETAHAQFSELLQSFPDCVVYNTYLQRTEHFMHNPPGEYWDGVYTFTTK